MADQQPADDDDGESIDPITDHESLRDHEDVPFHEVTDVVDGETVETVADLDDMAPVGVVNAVGEVLVMQVTEDCAWKIPSAAVEPGADYAATARQWVAEQAGLENTLEGIVGVRCFGSGRRTVARRRRATSSSSGHPRRPGIRPHRTPAPAHPATEARLTSGGSTSYRRTRRRCRGRTTSSNGMQPGEELDHQGVGHQALPYDDVDVLVDVVMDSLEEAGYL